LLDTMFCITCLLVIQNFATSTIIKSLHHHKLIIQIQRRGPSTIHVYNHYTKIAKCITTYPINIIHLFFGLLFWNPSVGMKCIHNGSLIFWEWDCCKAYWWRGLGYWCDSSHWWCSRSLYYWMLETTKLTLQLSFICIQKIYAY